MCIQNVNNRNENWEKKERKKYIVINTNFGEKNIEGQIIKCEKHDCEIEQYGFFRCKVNEC